MREAVVVILVVGGTVLVEARRRDQRVGVPVLPQQLIGGRQKRSRQILLPCVGVVRPELDGFLISSYRFPAPSQGIVGQAQRIIRQVIFRIAVDSRFRVIGTKGPVGLSARDTGLIPLVPETSGA